MDFTFGVIAKYSLPHAHSQDFLLFFSPTFIILGFTFRSTVCFELIFVYGMRCGSKFIYLHMHTQLFLYNVG